MKKISLILIFSVIFTLYSAKIYSQSSIQLGQFTFDKKDSGNTLWQGKIGGKASGERTATKEIRFGKPFNSVPEILISITNVDISTSELNLRYRIEPKYVSRDGFVISLSTWYDSEISSLSGNWIAVSED